MSTLVLFSPRWLKLKKTQKTPTQSAKKNQNQVLGWGWNYITMWDDDHIPEETFAELDAPEVWNDGEKLSTTRLPSPYDGNHIEMLHTLNGLSDLHQWIAPDLKWFSGEGAEEAQTGQCLEFIITIQHKQEEGEVGDEPNPSILLNRRKFWLTKRHFNVLVAQKISVAFWNITCVSRWISHEKLQLFRLGL